MSVSDAAVREIAIELHVRREGDGPRRQCPSPGRQDDWREGIASAFVTSLGKRCSQRTHPANRSKFVLDRYLASFRTKRRRIIR